MKKQIKNPDFLQIPHQVYTNRTLSAIDMLVYGLVYWYTHLKGEKCFASNQTFADILGVNIRKISESLARLGEAGCINVIYSDNTKKHREEIIPLVVYTKKSHSPIGLSDSPNGPSVMVRLDQVDSPNGPQNKKNEKEGSLREAKAPDKPVVKKYPNEWYQDVETAYRFAKGQIIQNDDGSFTEKFKSTSSEIGQLRRFIKQTFQAGYSAQQVKEFILFLFEDPYWSKEPWHPAIIPRRISDFVEGRMHRQAKRFNEVRF